MQNIQHTLLAFTIASAALAGCNKSGGEAVGTGQARITVAAVGSGSTELRVTAVDDATSDVAIERTIDLLAGSNAVLDYSLLPASYTLHVDVLGDDHASVVASRAAHVALGAGETIEVRLTTDLDAKNDGAIAIDFIATPRIDNVEVQITKLGAPDLLGATATATIHVDAVDSGGGPLKYFWSGLGIDGAVQGDSTLTLNSTTLAAHPGAPKVYVVVQNDAGATATAQVVFSPQNSCVLCGDYHVNLNKQGAQAVEAQACIDARASCTATCSVTSAAHPDDLDALGQCVSGCALSLAKCDAS